MKTRIVLALAVSFVLSTSWLAAQPAADSLRVEKTTFDVRLSWDPGTGPYGVYRSTSPQNVFDPANYHAVSGDLLYDDSLESATGVGVIYYYSVDVSPECKKDVDCDNSNPCDGVETCGSPPPPKRCEAGAPMVCNDGSSCTTDSCSPVSGSCIASAPDCDDGNPCTTGTCVEPFGCVYEIAKKFGRQADVSGNSLVSYPFFENARLFNEDAPVELAGDPSRAEPLSGQTCDVYVVEARDARGWCANRSLTDVRGAPDSLSFTGGTVQQNTFEIAAPLQLSSDGGTDLGKGYDIAFDCNANGAVDGGELVDGFGNQAGFYVVGDLSQAGPLAVNQFDDIGSGSDYCDFFPVGATDDMRVYYPADLDDPGFSGTFPLVVVSHGNGHCFDWYDFLGTHLASYGFIVMSHDNDTADGIETASGTTLDFTDRIIGEQATLGGGVLDGHIDSGRIAWIGHSRGGEGVVRAYDRLVDEAFPAQNYSASDILVISSIAPTDFLGPSQSDPKDQNYHLLYGSADGDVCGCPNNSVAQSFGLYERATGNRHSTYIHGADHNDFNCCGTNDFTGPFGTEIGRLEAQQVQKIISLATVKRYIELDPAAEDFFWRQYESFRPLGVASSTTVVNEYREEPAERSFVIDDYQTETGTGTSSSGGAVSFDVVAVTEALLREVDGQFTWTGGEPMNGMARARANDTTRGAVFEFSVGSGSFYEFAVVAGQEDFSDDDLLSFRIAQGTRHPLTTAALEDLTFSVALEDGSGASSAIDIGVFGGGAEEPYQRTGFGTGAGWQNEFETIRIRVKDFIANAPGLDLTDIRFVRFEFGTGSSEGRIAVDDVELVRD